ncbi:archaeosortase A [Halovivax cerinus]|uniref:Archaeosortase A n=1 Tax=Halovivax cerinus TaxID=1487865 RepID=A0ABD5NIW1_9EURY|nr:archaeosortase A [Halovivax cerinus]
MGASDYLAWLSIAAFVLAIGLEWRDEVDAARYVAAGASALFGIFWLTMVPHYWYEMRSPLETLLALAALPLCLYAAFLLVRGRESMLILVRAVAVMGIIYLPVETIPIAREWLIETTAYQTHLAMDLVAESPGLETGDNGYRSRFAFDPDQTATGWTTYIVLACTGIGSMAIFGGLIASVRAPLRRKAVGFVAAVGVIWFLNLVRNVIISLATPHGWFQHDVFVYVATEWMGGVEPQTSFLISHNVLFQPGSVIALIGIAYVVITIVPEVVEPLEEVLYVLTGSEYDLSAALGAEPETGKAAGD